jgi:hypothetical protein
MKTEIPDNVLEAIAAVVYWARSDEGPDDILEHDIPVLDDWIVELGLLPLADTPITDEEWTAFKAAKAAWEAGRLHAGNREERPKLASPAPMLAAPFLFRR